MWYFVSVHVNGAVCLSQTVALQEIRNRPHTQLATIRLCTSSHLRPHVTRFKRSERMHFVFRSLQLATLSSDGCWHRTVVDRIHSLFLSRDCCSITIDLSFPLLLTVQCIVMVPNTAIFGSLAALYVGFHRFSFLTERQCSRDCVRSAVASLWSPKSSGIWSVYINTSETFTTSGASVESEIRSECRNGRNSDRDTQWTDICRPLRFHFAQLQIQDIFEIVRTSLFSINSLKTQWYNSLTVTFS